MIPTRSPGATPLLVSSAATRWAGVVEQAVAERGVIELDRDRVGALGGGVREDQSEVG